MISVHKLSRRNLALILPTLAACVFASFDKTGARADQTASAPQPMLIQDGATAAKDYAHEKRAFDAYALTSGSLPDVMSDSGVNYDVDAVIEGRFSVNGQDMLLLAVGNDAIDAEVPHDFAPTWLSNTAHVRFIVRDAPPLPTIKPVGDVTTTDPTDSSTPQPAPSPAQSQNQTGVCTVLAAAPDDELTLMSGLVHVRDDSRPLPSRSGDFRSNYTTMTDAARYSAVEKATTGRYPKSMPMGHPLIALNANEAAVYPYYRYQIHEINRRLTDETLDKITTSLLAYSYYYKIDPRLIMAMIIAESSFDPNSTSKDGAMGLGQLMPGTAAGLISNPYDPVENVGGAVKILSDNVKMYGGALPSGLVPINTLLLSMAAYNAGNGAVQKYHGIPPYRETQVYVRRVARYYQQLCGD